jgi:exonuclease SbcC
MILKKLIMKNIRSYNDLELNFPDGSILLSGDIGSGKTSILLGVQFALFGLQPGQKGSSLIRAGESDALVHLEFEIDDKKIAVERTIKRSKNGSISQDSNIIEVNNKREELSTSEAKNRIIEMLNYPKEFVKKSNLLYKYTIYTPQESMKEIVQESPEIRLDTLRHIFGIDRYKRIKDNSEVFIQKLRGVVKIKEVEIRDINLIKEKIVLENEKKIKLSKEINNLNLDYNEMIKIKKEEELKIRGVENKILDRNKINSELIRAETELRGKKELKLRTEKEIDLMAKQIKDRVDFSSGAMQEVLNLIASHKKKLDSLNDSFLKISSNISVLLSRKENAFDLKEKIIHLESCPTCFQSVSAEHKDKISKRTQYNLEEIDRELESKMIEKNRLIREIETEKELVGGYENDLHGLERARIKYQHQRDIELKLKSDVMTLERINLEINSIEMNINGEKLKLEEFKDIEKQYDFQKNNLDSISYKSRLIEIELAQKNRELELQKINLDEMEKTLKKMEKSREQLNYIRGLQDWFEDKFISLITITETNVLAKLRIDFSRLFGGWFSMLVSDSLSVRLNEDFTPIITNQDFEIDYEFLSGGERTAVALAYRLALNQILNSILSKIKTKDLIILDEPTDGFSEQQLDKMRDIFEQLNSKQIILVSHEQKIEGFVDNVIRIKKDGASSVESVKS